MLLFPHEERGAFEGEGVKPTSVKNCAICLFDFLLFFKYSPQIKADHFSSCFALVSSFDLKKYCIQKTQSHFGCLCESFVVTIANEFKS